MGRSGIMKYLADLVARNYLGHPDQAEILLIKYPRFRDLPAALFNELRFRIGSSRAHRLTALNVELTNRCNLRCSICPRRDAGARPDCDLDLETFKKIVDTTPGLRVLLPFQWGEPLLSPILIPAIKYAVAKGIRVFVTTNGTLLDEKTADALVRSGLERLTVSFDGNPRTFESQRRSGKGDKEHPAFQVPARRCGKRLPARCVDGRRRIHRKGGARFSQDLQQPGRQDSVCAPLCIRPANRPLP